MDERDRMKDEFHIRLASADDISTLRELIEASVRTLQANDYTAKQIEGAVGTVQGLDTQLIADQTYFVVEAKDSRGESTIVGIGGWSKRRTLFGADRLPTRQDELLDPEKDAARIRAFFVHPQWARKGIGTILLEGCESAARAEGFNRFELGSTLTGFPFYSARGYRELDRIEVPMANGEKLPVIRMEKLAPP